MKLFNKTIDRELFKQYALGSDLAKQNVVVKIFNPVANGTWFILNSDPEDPDYLWAIVDLGYGAEVGSVSRSELENYRGQFGLGFERDLGFDPVNAEELFRGLRQGKYYDKGGEVSFIDYNESEIMYEPHNKKYYANDVEFHSLQEAKDFIDSGETDAGIRDAYSKGMFAEGGNLRQSLEEVLKQDVTFLKFDSGRVYDKFLRLDIPFINVHDYNFNHYCIIKTENLEKVLDNVSKGVRVVKKKFSSDDLGFDYKGSKSFAEGGNIENFSDNQQMIMNQNVELEHHHEELEDILKDEMPVPAWVVAKMATATQSVSDITHYLDGEKELMEDEDEEDDDEDEIKNKEVVEPINVSAGTKAELTKKFTDDAMGNLKGFLKGMEGIDLRDDYTFDYKNEQFEFEPIISSDEKGVSNAVFTIFDGDGEEVGEVTYSRDGGKQKFTANSELFIWNNAKFEDGGFMADVYAKGGEIAKAEILGLKRNIMGTTDIEMKITGMRKPQDFIVYPIGKDDAGNVITIQSDTRIGQINLVKGVGVMSQSHPSGAYFVHLQMDKLTSFTISERDLDDLKIHILKTAGSRVGNSIIKSDNAGASKVFADGGSVKRTRRTKDQMRKDEYNKEVDLYNWYVVNISEKRAESGFEYKEDAVDLLSDYDGDKNFKVVSKKALKTLGIEIPNESWKYAEGGFMTDVYANGGGIGFIPMDLEEDLRLTAKWGGTDINGVIGILNAMIDSGLTDEDLKPKPTKSGTANQNAIEKKANEIWSEIEPKYKGDLKGNMPYGTIRRLVDRANSSDDILKRFKPFRKNQNDSYADGGGLKKYILKADIKTVTVKRKGKEVTYKGADVLNGANVLAKGGDISSKANYVPKRDVVEVELKDGSKVKPVNGYWVKKGAEPIDAEPTSTSSGSSEPKIDTTQIRKDPRGNWRAETQVKNFNNYDWKITTIKTSSGNLLTSAQGGKFEQGDGYVTFKYIVFQDPNHTLEVSKPKRLTDKVVSEQHTKGLEKFKKFMETGMFKGGGKISNFDKLSAKVAKEYEGKPVQSQYQEEYGKYYSKEEAQEVGDKVAGKVKAMQSDKKAFGGFFGGAKSLIAPSKKYPDLKGQEVKLKTGELVQVFTQNDDNLTVLEMGKFGTGETPHAIKFDDIDTDSFKMGGVTKTSKNKAGSSILIQANDLAKKIRKSGESWQDAKKRAFAELKKTE